jgi:hypothetical protein
MKRALLPAVLALLACVPAHAETCTETEAALLAPGGYQATLQALAANCLGRENDTGQPLVTQVQTIDPNKDIIFERFLKMRAVATAMSEFARNQQAVSPDPEAWARLEQAASIEASKLSSMDENMSVEEFQKLEEKSFSAETWAIDSGTFASPLLRGVQLKGVDFGSCPAASSPGAAKCANYVSMKEIVRFINVGTWLGDYARRDPLAARVHALDLRDKQWDAYFDEALFQWWWEVGLNGYRMKNSSLCARNAYHMQVGYCDVPHDQLIFLHPDVGLQWMDGAENTSDLHGAVVLEVFGYNKWRWDGATAKSAKGLSLVATYSDAEDNKDWAYGLMFHGRNKYSFGVTTNGHRVGLVFNLALSDRFFEVKDRYRGYLKQLEKPKLLDVVSGKWKPTPTPIAPQ